ncbi:putative sporulation protein (polysaccharide deacetylase family) [Evansella vedderi]|uniref:Sporulation protein (Polysaccharide deacetylase family) n=1 Tax=Evansella vedderi TaxID=38282 RepID=A0ABT9ZR01_9BACI|nr:polysaccharide deacetylase family protein [Evansella vedderi]MDQ0253663.1 putative sporulation protein (polysaccharide deacetylase family) [Evansella vedderi]
MMKRFILQSATFILILLLSFSSVEHPITTGYINELRDQAITVMKEEDPLYMELLRKQNEYKVEPQDAVIDKVWKAIPGLNGLSVDVQASYEAMKEDGFFQEDKLVFNQIPPEVTLKDLPPSPIYRGHSEKPMVTFMVNVAWGNEYLPDILKIMNKYDIKSTFFLDGSWVKNNPTLAKMIVEEGHEIGNHAYSHPDMKNLTRERIIEEIVKTNEVIKDTINQEPKWFAPPSGSYRQEVVEVADELGMNTVLWTVDTIDWRKPEPRSMADRIIAKSEAGSLVLMHPTSSTADGLEIMIEGIMNKGFKLGTLSETLSENRIQ